MSTFSDELKSLMLWRRKEKAKAEAVMNLDLTVAKATSKSEEEYRERALIIKQGNYISRINEIDSEFIAKRNKIFQKKGL